MFQRLAEFWPDDTDEVILADLACDFCSSSVVEPRLGEDNPGFIDTVCLQCGDRARILVSIEQGARLRSVTHQTEPDRPLGFVSIR